MENVYFLSNEIIKHKKNLPVLSDIDGSTSYLLEPSSHVAYSCIPYTHSEFQSSSPCDNVQLYIYLVRFKSETGKEYFERV